MNIELNWFYSTPTTITCTHMNDYISIHKHDTINVYIPVNKLIL